MLQGQQTRCLFDTGHAPGGPETEDDSAAAQTSERDVLAAISQGELGGKRADAGGVIAAVACSEGERTECDEKNSGSNNWYGYAHARLLLPIIRICERYG